MMRRLRALSVSLLVVVWAGLVGAEDPLAIAQLEVRGNRLTIFSDESTDDASQVLNVGEPAVVRTCFGAVDAPCGEVSPTDSRIAGLVVRADLAGPQLPDPVPLEIAPGGSFHLPAFQQEGTYTLENIRLVRSATDEVLGWSEPPVATLVVVRIAIATATVTTLSLEQLEARGITLSQENFQSFNFTVGFAFGGEIVNLELPVLYEGNGLVSPLSGATVDLSGLSDEENRALVERWQPPNIIPFALEPSEEEEVLDTLDEENEVLNFPMFGAIVLPGNVSFLNQFFEARLIVANGAPAGSEVDLVDLQGLLRLPSGNVLRIADTAPPTAAGQWVPVLDTVNGGHVVEAGRQATAAWTVEGLTAGTHLLRMEIEGEIHRPGRDPYPVRTATQAAVDVVDARFHLAFTHPDVVRDGSEYSLLVTVSNLSRVTQNMVMISLDPARITGAHPIDDDVHDADDLVRSAGSLVPGASATVEFRLEADVTGKVAAATFETDSDSTSGSIHLVTGVGELGIPLSPATLRLPRFSDLLAPPYVPDDGFQREFLRFLGLAYSLAVAPSGLNTTGLPAVIRSDVEQRAIDLAAAGQRIYLGEEVLPSIEVMSLDLLGNGHPLAAIDELRRRLDRGLTVGAELGDLLRWQQDAKGLGAVELLDHFATTTSYMDAFVVALWIPDDPTMTMAIQSADGTRQLVGRLGAPLVGRGLAFGDVIGVSSAPGGAADADLALIGAVGDDERFVVRVSNPTASDHGGRLVLLVPDADGAPRWVDAGRPTVPAGSSVILEIGASEPDTSQGGFVLRSGATGTPTGDVVMSHRVTLPPFRLIGARQDFLLGSGSQALYVSLSGPNRYGQGLSYLFNRPPDETLATDPANYRIHSIFNGEDAAGVAVTTTSDLKADAAFLQTTGRVVNVRYDSPISPLIDQETASPLVSHTHLEQISNLVDTFGNGLEPDVPNPLIEEIPEHHGGLVGGRVVRGTGVAVAGATVQLIRSRKVEIQGMIEIVLDKVGETTTGVDGDYFFEFVEDPHPDSWVLPGFTLRAMVPEGSDPGLEPAGVEEVSSRIRLFNRMARINIALLGRGSVTGHLRYAASGLPVPDGHVTASSSLFNEQKTVAVDDEGSFEILGLPVGPITVAGRDVAGRTAWATVGIERPGDIVTVDLELTAAPPPGQGTVRGRVLARSGGVDGASDLPVAGADVAIWSDGVPIGAATTGSAGGFRFDRVPEGRVVVQAAEWQISRTPAMATIPLGAGETVELELVLAAGRDHRVVGEVKFADPTTGNLEPVAGANVFVEGPGVYAQTDADGWYVIEGVPEQGADTAGGQVPNYKVVAIDNVRNLQGQVQLLPVIGGSPDPILAQKIVLREMRGRIKGVVLDPYGRPAGGVTVVAAFEGSPYYQRTTLSDGSFAFDDLRIGEWGLTAHRGNGLETGYVGWFGSSGTEIVFGGQERFVTVGMVGSGFLNLHVLTSGGQPTLSPIYYKPTYFSESSQRIVVKGAYTETTTSWEGNLRLEVPVGSVEIVAYNAFYGALTVGANLEWAGQVKDVDIRFSAASRVVGRVVDVDGQTPIADIEVTLESAHLFPQTLRTNELGEFAFELVPEGRVRVRVAGELDGIERVGAADGRITGGGQELDLRVRLKAQGAIRGRIVLDDGDTIAPFPFARYYVVEESYPYRRLPAFGGWYTADANGRFEVAHLYEGAVRVVGWDGENEGAQGKSSGEIRSDWDVVDVADVVLRHRVASLAIEVRDPDSGVPLPDCPVKLEMGSGLADLSVTDGSGVAVFDALALGSYSALAFHAPTGRSGRGGPWSLTIPNEVRRVTVTVDSRGRITGTLFDGPGFVGPVGGGVVDLRGSTSGGPMTAVASTSGSPATLGQFAFGGIPEGTFDLTAGLLTSPRRAGATVELTATSLDPDINLVLEPVHDVWVRVFETPREDVIDEINPAAGVLAVELIQGGGNNPSYNVALTSPTVPFPGHLYRFPDVLTDRSGLATVYELDGERRAGRISMADFDRTGPFGGSGSEADPYLVVLGPKGVVRVTVRDANGVLLSGADVTLQSRAGTFPSATSADGTVVFVGVPAGSVTATATSPLTGFGGRASGQIVYDDDVIELEIQLAPVVSAHGQVFLPTTDDAWSGDPAELVAAAGVWVTIETSAGSLTTLADDEGSYRFDVLATGNYSLQADSTNGDAIGKLSGRLDGPDGHDNLLPDLIMDGSPPRILSIVPTPGMRDVSPAATVEIVFSERLLSDVLPAGPTSWYFELSSNAGPAVGTWSSTITSDRRQVVRFTPTELLASTTTYSLIIRGGSGGVCDLVNRPLTPSGDVGATFTTADTVGPKVLRTEPDISRPFDAEALLRVDFNEVVAADDGALDDEAIIQWMRSDGQWALWPGSLASTRQGYSLLIDPREDLILADDSLLRRVVVSDLSDAFGNPAPAWSRDFRVRDVNAPVVDALPPPVNAPTGELSAGNSYELVPVLSGIDHFPVDPSYGDLDRVDFFFVDPDSEGAQPIFTAMAPPWSFPFTATYSGGGEPQPRSVWVRAADTSTNQSNVVELDLVVLPNRPPTIASVDVSATSPVGGVPYAGSQLQAAVSGLDDPDGAQISVSVELRRADGSAILSSAPVVSVSRPTSGTWADAPPVVFSLTIPITEPEGASLVVRAVARDSHGGEGIADSSLLTVADDATSPVIDRLVARHADSLEPASSFLIGESLVIEVQAHDVETRVDAITLGLDAYLPTPLEAHRVTGDLYRTDAVEVPHSVFNEPVTVVITAHATDIGGNAGQSTLDIELAPDIDPTAPTVEWLTPWEGAPWPADYVSSGGTGGTPFLMQVRVTDLDPDGDGSIPPAVSFRGPVADGLGGAELVAVPSAGLVVPGTETPGGGDYRVAWTIPDGLAAGTELPFEVTVVDSGNHERTARVRMQAVAPRRVYERVTTSVATTDPMLAAAGDPDGPVFLVDGAELSVVPQTDGTIRHLSELVLYAGADEPATIRASVLTAPEVTSASSSRTFFPLELSLDRLLAVGVGARIDLSGVGVLGGTIDGGIDLEGPTAARVWIGGSHGGRGWWGSPSSGWERTNLLSSADVYDNLRDPRLAGLGGGGHGSAAIRGGQGGGVVWIDAPDAVVHIAGGVRADGLSGPGGGAGGSIRVVAARIEGPGAITARGGGVTDTNRAGSGGGGRISLRYRELTDLSDLEARIDASGGLTGAGSGLELRGGAGTVYLEQADGATDTWSGPGRLVVSGSPASGAAATTLPALADSALTAVDATTATLQVSSGAVGSVAGDLLVIQGDMPDDDLVLPILEQADLDGGLQVVVDAAPAVLDDLAARFYGGESLVAHSRTRVVAFRVQGTARVDAAGDLEVGIDAPVVNDRSAIEFVGDGRVRLRGETVSLDVTTSVPAGSDVRVGSTIGVGWTGVDTLGLAWVREEWSAAGTTVDAVWPTHPLEVTSPPQQTSIVVPPTTPPGSVTWRVITADLSGRQVEHEVEWTVLPNDPPTGLVRLADGVPDSVHAGGVAQVTVEAADLEGLAQVQLDIAGPVTTPQLTRNLSGLSAVTSFDLAVQQDAPAGSLVITGIVRDTSGSEVPIGPLTVTVLADTEPPAVAIDVTPVRTDDVYAAGDRVTVNVSASDDVRVTSLVLSRDGDVMASTTGAAIDWRWTAPSVAEDTVFELGATATDPTGNTTTVSRPITVQPNQNPDAPIVSILCPFDGDGCAVGATSRVRFTVTDTDPIHSWWLLVDGEQMGDPIEVGDGILSYNGTATWSPPADAQPGDVFELTIEARDFNLENVGRSTVYLTTLEGTTLDGDQQLTTPHSGESLILGSGTYTATVDLEPASLTLLPGATLTTPAMRTLTIDTTGDVVVECGASIDAVGRGYPRDTTYPDVAGPSSSYSTGSHLGEGVAFYGIPGETYGSVTRPLEFGAGGRSGTYPYVDGRAGGGVLVIRSRVLELKEGGEINADGDSLLGNNGRGGAGGSIWIQAEDVNGSGAISAAGGDGDLGTGGGGAIAIEYTGSLSPAIRDRLSTAAVSDNTSLGGAGTIWLKSPASLFGELIVDNIDHAGNRTVLPSLGSGTVIGEPDDVRLVSNRPDPRVFPWVIGRWIRVYEPGPEKRVRGMWRVVLIEGTDLVLESGADAQPGDSWQAVYPFDSVRVSGAADLYSDDPIITGTLDILGAATLSGSSNVEVADVTLAGTPSGDSRVLVPVSASNTIDIFGRVTAADLSAPTVTVHSDAVLRHPQGSAHGLVIDASTKLEVEDNGAIDVTGQGYPHDTTYPNVELPTHDRSTGSHLGEGGASFGTPGETYGSVTRPLELGSGGMWVSGAGGGLVVIRSGTLDLNESGSIKADGSMELGTGYRSGAGGSVWIQADRVVGSGRISAVGGNSDWGTGGGGAIALELTESLAQTVRDEVSAASAIDNPPLGGAGTIWIKGPSSVYGELIVDNHDRAGASTILPPLGSGTAVVTDNEVRLVSDLPDPPSRPDWAVGRWIRVTAPDGTDHGTWRVASVDDRDLILQGDTTVEDGDLWQAVYPFDSVVVRGLAHLVVGDLDDFGTVTVEPGSTLTLMNDEGPTVFPSLAPIGAHDWRFVVMGGAGAISDPNGIASALVRNTVSGETHALMVSADGSFGEVTIPGNVGDAIEIEATDAHAIPRTSTVAIGTLPANAAPPTIADIGFPIEAIGAGTGYQIAGPAGSVADENPPVRLHAVNTATLEETSRATATADGSFVLYLGTFADNAGDPIQLVATDSHPERLSSTVALGPMPDLHPPHIYDDKIVITTTSREYRVVGDSDAIFEENDGTVVSLSDGAGATINALYDDATGGFQSPPLPWPSGTPVTVIATDVGANSSDLAIGQLPANAGPPTIEPSDVDHFTADGLYVVEGGKCPRLLTVGSSSSGTEAAKINSYFAPIRSLDGLAAVRLENRSTPGFGTWSATFYRGSNCPASYSTFTPVTVDGALGDKIVLVAEDDHPEWLAAEAVVWTLWHIPGNPVISVASANLLYLGGVYHLSTPANSITSASGPLTLEARVWRPDGDDWLEIGTTDTTIASGDAVDLLLPAGCAEGDLVVVSATDVDGRVTRVRAGRLPAAIEAPSIDPAGFGLVVDGCSIRLEAQAGSVTTDYGSVTAYATVSHPSLVGSWSSTPVAIDVAADFSIDLEEVEPGSEVWLTATDASSRSTTTRVKIAPDDPPVFDPASLWLILRDDGRAYVGLTTENLTHRLPPLSMTFSNLHPNRTSSVDSSVWCDGGWTEPSLPAEVGDPLQVVFCNGDRVRVCSDPIDLGAAPYGHLVEFEFGTGVSGIERQRRGVMVMTGDGGASVLALAGQWEPNPWVSPMVPPGPDPISGLVAVMDWNVVVAAGDELALFDLDGTLTQVSTPIESGVSVDAWRMNGSHLFTVGRSLSTGAVFVSSTMTGWHNAGEICGSVAATELTLADGARPLALTPLAPGRLGLVVDELVDVDGVFTAMLTIDVSDPDHPEILGGSDTVQLAGLDSPPVSARVEDDHLEVISLDGRLRLYRLTDPMTWSARLDIGPIEGAIPTASTKWGESVFVGFDDGAVRRFTYADALQIDPPADAVMPHPGESVLAMTSNAYTVLAAFPSKVEAYHHEGWRTSPDTHYEGIRFDGATLSVAPCGIESTDQGVDLVFSGEGRSVDGTPTAVSTTAQLSAGDRFPRQASVELPNVADEVDSIRWDSLTLTDRESGRSVSLDLHSQVIQGPPFFDRDCHSGVHACRITTGAAGPGWRASAGPGIADPQRIRYRIADEAGWQERDIDAEGAVYHLTSRGNLLLASADSLMVADFSDIQSLRRAVVNPFPGDGVGPTVVVPGTPPGTERAIVAARSGLRLAVVDLADPQAPSIVTTDQPLLDGAGAVVDLHVAGDGSIWLLATDPDRLLRLDGEALPTLSVVEDYMLPGPAPVAALDDGTFDSIVWGEGYRAIFVVRRGSGLEMYDRDAITAGAQATLEIEGDPRDVFVADSSSGLRVLVAAGLDRGVVELVWDDDSESWNERWLADLGHVRAFTYAPDAFRPGQIQPESCDDVGGMDTKSTVPATGTPRLFAVTEAGIVPVDISIDDGSFGGPPISVLPGGFGLDLGGCVPRLVAAPGAVIGQSATLDVEVTIDNAAPAPDVTAATFTIASGDEFDVELGGLELGGSIQLHVSDDDGFERLSTVAVMPVEPPTVDPARVRIEHLGYGVYVTIEQGALDRRLEAVSFTVFTDTASVEPVPECAPDRLGFDYLDAAAGEMIYLQACNGDDSTTFLECGDPVAVGRANLFPLLEEVGVTALQRRGPTVMVGLDDGTARVVSLDDVEIPVVLPWTVVLPGGNPPTAVIGRGPDWLAFTAGDSLVTWRLGGGLESLAPFGEGTPVEAALVLNDRIVVAGAPPEGVVVVEVGWDPSTGDMVCPSGAALVTEDTAGLRPLAIAPLGGELVGVVVEGETSLRAVDVGDPGWLIEDPWSGAVLGFSPESAVAATVADGVLAVAGEDDVLRFFRLPPAGAGPDVRPLELTLQPLFEVEDGDMAGLLTTAMWGGMGAIVASNAGSLHIVGTLGYDVTVDLGDAPLMGATGAFDIAIVATSTGVYQMLVDYRIAGPRLGLDGLRADAAGVYLGPAAFQPAQFGASWSDSLEVSGTGDDANGDPADRAVSLHLDSPTWLPFNLELPDAVDGATNLIWTSLSLVDTYGTVIETFDLADDSLRGPTPMPATCGVDASACSADVAAAGPGWRAWAAAGSDLVTIRTVGDVTWIDEQLTMPGVADLANVGDLLVVSRSAGVTVIVPSPDGADVVGTTDVFGAPSGKLQSADTGGGEMMVSVADGFTVAAVAISGYEAPAILVPPTVVYDGVGRIVDLVDGLGDVLVVADDPARAIALWIDTETGPEDTIEVGGVLTLAPGPPLRTIGLGYNDFPTVGEEMEAYWVLRDDGVLELYDSEGSGDVEATVLLPGAPRDLWADECSFNNRVLVAAGVGLGILEVHPTLDPDAPEPLTWSWFADIGDARRFVFTDDAFYFGSGLEEGCPAVAPSATCSPRLLSLTAAGLQPVPVDLCNCGQ